MSDISPLKQAFPDTELTSADVVSFPVLVGRPTNYPPEVQDPVSIEFMQCDLARSGITAGQDILVYPTTSAYKFNTNGVVEPCGAYVICYTNAFGEYTPMYRIRYDRKVNKYIGPKKINEPWLPPRQRGLKKKILLVEGEKKGASAVVNIPVVREEYTVICIGGCYNAMEKQLDGRDALVQLILDAVKQAESVAVSVDGDVETNPRVNDAMHRLDAAIRGFKIPFTIFRPPTPYKGLDDWIVAEKPTSLHGLVSVDLECLGKPSLQMCKQLGCTFSDKGMHSSERNIALIISHIFEQHVVWDPYEGIVPYDSQLILHQDVRSTADMSTEMTPQGGLTAFEQDVINLMQKYWPNLKYSVILTALHNLVALKQVNILRDNIRSTVWDGVARLDTLGEIYAPGADLKEANDFFRRLVTGTALHIDDPRVHKLHLMFILYEPRQGGGKTTFFNEFFTFKGKSYYTNLDSLTFSRGDENRTQAAKLRQNIGVIFDEALLLTHNPREQNLIKTTITKEKEDYREVYAKRSIEFYLRNVFCGTTNQEDVLTVDPSGSRRMVILPLTLHSDGEPAILPLPEYIRNQAMAEAITRSDELVQRRWWDSWLTLEDIPTDVGAPGQYKSYQEYRNTQHMYCSGLESHIADIIDQQLQGGSHDVILQCLKFDGVAWVIPTYKARELYKDAEGREGNASQVTHAFKSFTPAFSYSVLVGARLSKVDLAIPAGFSEYGYSGELHVNIMQARYFVLVPKANPVLLEHWKDFCQRGRA